MNQIIDTYLRSWDLHKLDYYRLKNENPILAKTYLQDEVQPQMADAGVTCCIGASY